MLATNSQVVYNTPEISECLTDANLISRIFLSGAQHALLLIWSSKNIAITT